MSGTGLGWYPIFVGGPISSICFPPFVFFHLFSSMCYLPFFFSSFFIVISHYQDVISLSRDMLGLPIFLK